MEKAGVASRTRYGWGFAASPILHEDRLSCGGETVGIVAVNLINTLASSGRLSVRRTIGLRASGSTQARKSLFRMTGWFLI